MSTGQTFRFSSIMSCTASPRRETMLLLVCTVGTHQYEIQHMLCLVLLMVTILQLLLRWQGLLQGHRGIIFLSWVLVAETAV